MRYVFYCSSGPTCAFNQPLNHWDVSSVTIMAYMFYKANAFNQPLNDWDVSSVTTIEFMFSGASAFDQDLGWCVLSTVKTYEAFSYSGCSSDLCGVHSEPCPTETPTETPTTATPTETPTETEVDFNVCLASVEDPDSDSTTAVLQTTGAEILNVDEEAVTLTVVSGCGDDSRRRLNDDDQVLASYVARVDDVNAATAAINSVSPSAFDAMLKQNDQDAGSTAFDNVQTQSICPGPWCGVFVSSAPTAAEMAPSYAPTQPETLYQPSAQPTVAPTTETAAPSVTPVPTASKAQAVA